MRHPILAAAALAALTATLSACQKKEEAFAPGPHFGVRGRFAGVGLYDAGQAWRLQTPTTAAKPADPALARLDDDDTILVVLDSVTGEVRQCGNMSGRCLTMNPWTRPVEGAAVAPALLTDHPADALRREEPPATVEIRRKPD